MRNPQIKLHCFSTLFSVAFLSFLLIPPSTFGEDRPGAQTGPKIEKGIILLITFPDVTNDFDRTRVEKRFGEQLNNYVKEMSHGRVSLAIDVTRQWYKMPKPVSAYKISPRNLEVDKSRVSRLIADAVDLADDEIDFSKYSFAAIFMNAKFAEYGMIGLCGYPGMLGWNSRDVLKSRKGEAIKGMAIFSFQAHLGTLFHDIAHILGGVKDGKRVAPCLYDHDLQAKPGPVRDIFNDSLINMGFWDPLSCHYIERDLPPPGLSSWTRIRLNWIDPSKVKVVKPGETAELVLDPIEDGSKETLVVKIPLSATQFYLIENRQPIGFDQGLPGGGVLIMYADDSIPECRHGQAPVKLMNADPSVPYLKGAAFDVGKKDTFLDPKNHIRIQIKEKSGNSYKVVITPL